jgi:hypothetical protein
MPGLFSRLYTKATGQVIDAAERNAEFQNIIDKLEPQYIDDQSADATAMRAVVDPGESGSESLATTLKGELERLRFAIKEIKGTTYWYQTPSTRLDSLYNAGTITLDSDEADTNVNVSTVVGLDICSNIKYTNAQQQSVTLTFNEAATGVQNYSVIIHPFQGGLATSQFVEIIPVSNIAVTLTVKYAANNAPVSFSGPGETMYLKPVIFKY